MLYCFSRNTAPNERIKREMIRAKKEHAFIYYNFDQKKFLDENNQEVEIQNKDVMPICGALELNQMLEALETASANIPNPNKEIEKISEWYKYITPKRKLITFRGAMLDDQQFLLDLFKEFSKDLEVFLKTKRKDFNGIVILNDIFDKNSKLRKALSYHLDDEFIITKKVDIDSDYLEKEEYRAFIKDRNIMNISRTVDKTYHVIPNKVIDYIKSVVEKLPQEFPNTFVLDVFSYNNQLDILEFNPLETSEKYLYNSVFEMSNDLSHMNIRKVPEERLIPDLSYIYNEASLRPSTTKSVENSFAKDYDDIKKYGDRQKGHINICGLPEGAELNLNLATIFNNDATTFSDKNLVNNDSKVKNKH